MLPPTLKVCGRNLLPFSLRHRVALEAIGSPVITPGKACTVSDLLFAVRILSSHELADSRRPTTWYEHYLACKFTVSSEAFAQQLVNLHIYLEAQALWPRFWEKKEKANHGGIPWHLSIVAGLMRYGCDLEKAWTMPEAEAVWLYIANCKADGARIDLITDEEFDAMARASAEIAKTKTQPTRN
jgi:hypothetical protein